MIGTALKNFAAQHQLAVNGGIAYGYIQGCFVTLSETLFAKRLSIYVGCVDIPLPEGEELSPAAKCSVLIVDMVTKASGEQNVYGLLRNRFIPALVLNHSGSVVTLNFRRDKTGLSGLQRFIAEMLPRITPLTAPLQCSHCGGHTGGQGYPVQIAPDAVAPMHAGCFSETVKTFEKEHGGRNAWVRGLIGAVIGVAIGTALWLLTGQRVWAAILTFVLGEIGYVLAKGRSGLIQWGIVAACMVAALLVGTGVGWVQTLHQQYMDYGTVVQDMMTESLYTKVALRDLLSDGAATRTALLNILIPLAVHALFHILDLLRARKVDVSRPKAMPGQA